MYSIGSSWNNYWSREEISIRGMQVSYKMLSMKGIILFMHRGSLVADDMSFITKFTVFDPTKCVFLLNIS